MNNNEQQGLYERIINMYIQCVENNYTSIGRMMDIMQTQESTLRELMINYRPSFRNRNNNNNNNQTSRVNTRIFNNYPFNITSPRSSFRNYQGTNIGSPRPNLNIQPIQPIQPIQQREQESILSNISLNDLDNILNLNLANNRYTNQPHVNDISSNNYVPDRANSPNTPVERDTPHTPEQRNSPRSTPAYRRYGFGNRHPNIRRYISTRNNRDISNNVSTIINETINNASSILEHTDNLITQSTRAIGLRNNSYNPFTTPLAGLPQEFLRPVIIRPTQLQIRNATRNIVFSEIINPVNERCPISLEPFTNDMLVTQILYCRHLFTQNNFTEWFNSNVRCPVCRYDIRNYNIRSRYSLYNDYTNTNNNNNENDSFTSPSSDENPLSPIVNRNHINNSFYDEEIELNDLNPLNSLNGHNEEHIENEDSDEQDEQELQEEELQEEEQDEEQDEEQHEEQDIQETPQQQLLEQVFNNEISNSSGLINSSEIPNISELIINSNNNSVNNSRYLEEFLDNQLSTMAREIQNFSNHFGDNIDLQLTAETTFIRDPSDNLV